MRIKAKILPPLLAPLALATLTACYGTQTGSGAPEKKIETCEAIRTLTESHQQQFADIRRAKRSYDRIDIWSTSYQIVGSGCEIWAWQGGHFNYICNYVAPDENSAREIYQNARTSIASCLSEDWTQKEQALTNSPGNKTLYESPDSATVIDLRLMETRGISTPRWAVYFLIGDPNTEI